MTTLVIEADGAIKCCAPLPTAADTGGIVRQRRIADSVATAPELTFNARDGRSNRRDELWRFCRTRTYAAACRGGCPWSAHTVFGWRRNNPHCHHRALVPDRDDRRERPSDRISRRVPFDHSRFTLVTEPTETAWPEHDTYRLTVDRVHWPDVGRTP